MGVDTLTATVVGVSYIDKLEKEGLDDILDHEADVTDLDLSVWTNQQRFDQPDDVYIGVVFHDRPTDAEVAEAKAKVEAALPQLKELLGEPSSSVEVWQGVCVC